MFFDVGNTLLDYAIPNYVGWADALAPLGGPSAEALSAALEEVLGGWQTPAGTLESPEDHRDVWSGIYGRVLQAAGFKGRKEAAVELMWDVWLHRVWAPYPEVIPVLSKLRAGGLRLAVVSNWSPTLALTLAHLELAEYFDAIVCSALLGCAKPDAAIFRHAVECMGVDCSRVLHVGDSYDADVLGAQGAGLDAALVSRGSDVAYVGYRPTLRSLDELFALFDEDSETFNAASLRGARRGLG